MADENKNEDVEAAKADDEGLGDAGKRALETERKARRKAEADLRAAREELAQIKADSDSSKSEVEKLAGKIEQLEREANEAKAAALRAEVAQAKGLSPKLAARLSGSTREELEADADDLLDAVGGGKKNDAGAKPEDEKKDDEGAKPEDETPAFGTPKEDLKPGSSNEDDETPDAAKLADSILKSW